MKYGYAEGGRSVASTTSVMFAVAIFCELSLMNLRLCNKLIMIDYYYYYYYYYYFYPTPSSRMQPMTNTEGKETDV